MVMKEPEVGGELDAYCTKCKSDTGHIIVALSGAEVKRVECKSCGGHHNYRKPKSAAAAPKVKVKVKKAPGERRSRASSAPPMDEASWDIQMRGLSSASIRDYQQDSVFSAGEVIAHQHFGIGRVEDVLRNKMKVAFRQGAKLLICKDRRR